MLKKKCDAQDWAGSETNSKNNCSDEVNGRSRATLFRRQKRSIYFPKEDSKERWSPFEKNPKEDHLIPFCQIWVLKKSNQYVY
jgi:hypothetical protein